MSRAAALVTGGAVRLGHAISLALARGGMDVVVHYRHSSKAAADTCREIQALGGHAWAVCADLAKPTESERLFAAAREVAGPIAVLVNNASVFPESTLWEFTEEDLTLNVRVNALAPLWLSKAFARQSRPGAIVNVLDSRVVGRDDGHVAYHLSKRMLSTLTRMMARDLAPAIRVNAVAPGLVLPPVGKDADYLDELARDLPLERHGSAEDVAAAVVFLVASEFITGQVIFVDGGRHLEGIENV